MNALIKIFITSMLLSASAYATNGPRLTTSCRDELMSPKASTVDISAEYSTVAQTSSFANLFVGVIITVPEAKREAMIENLRALLVSLGRSRGDLSFHSNTLVVGDESLVHVQLYGRDLAYVARNLRFIQAIDLELEEKHALGVPNHLPNRDVDPQFIKFNRRLFDPLVRLPHSQFQVIVGLARPDQTQLIKLENRLKSTFTILRRNIADQFIEVRGEGSKIISLKNWPEVKTVEAPLLTSR